MWQAITKSPGIFVEKFFAPSVYSDASLSSKYVQTKQISIIDILILPPIIGLDPYKIFN